MTDHGDAIDAVLAATGKGVSVRLKVVPGASRTRIVGLLDNRLKIAVSAAPADGQANRAVCELLAKVFATSKRHVVLVRGQTQPLKTAEIHGASLSDITTKLKQLLQLNS